MKEFVFHACTSWEAPEKISQVFNLKDQDWNVGRYFIDNRVDVVACAEPGPIQPLPLLVP